MISQNALTASLVPIRQVAEQLTVRSGLPDSLRQVRGLVIDHVERIEGSPAGGSGGMRLPSLSA
jgi:hypothetical protein